ncbi:unnamed protein product [Sphenostylis stenocarpa]|uniref:Uncharacterized protein n=1 Tax=Sphenostylis stenocarpa TaxID=92480 RepID=A0AA87BA31_9FABA|nr:unnamed protein product [Sphenostylis stenocarpa]
MTPLKIGLSNIKLPPPYTRIAIASLVYASVYNTLHMYKFKSTPEHRQKNGHNNGSPPE